MRQEVDLGAFQPLAFLSAIGKNIVNFITPGQAIFPTVKQVAIALPTSSLTDILAQPALDLKIRAPDITLFETTLVKPTTTTFTELMSTVLPTTTPVASTGNIFTTVWDTIKGPTETFLNFFLTKGQLEATTSIAQSQADAERAAQAVVQAQERIIATQTQQQKENQGILSTEAWEKATPYVVPIAAGLTIVAVLLLISKGKKGK